MFSSWPVRHGVNYSSFFYSLEREAHSCCDLSRARVPKREYLLDRHSAASSIQGLTSLSPILPLFPALFPPFSLLSVNDILRPISRRRRSDPRSFSPFHIDPVDLSSNEEFNPPSRGGLREKGYYAINNLTPRFCHVFQAG